MGKGVELKDAAAGEAAAPRATAGPSAMSRESIALAGPDGTEAQNLTVFRFGSAGARPKAYLQASLHADELPGMMVLRDLIARLTEEAERGRILGEIVVVPVANPIGLAQHGQGRLSGRFDERSGGNFNRNFPDLASDLASNLSGQLGQDAAQNTAAIRTAMADTLAAQSPAPGIEALQHQLLLLACDADIVLDLHADNEALMHLYTGPALWPDTADLAAELDARAVLLAADSGGHPFDEACSAPWWRLAAAFPDLPIPPACLAATVELRSNNQVEERLASIDAGALFRFLMRRGLVEGTAGELPRLMAEATPLEAMQQVKAPAEGVVLYHLRLGDRVRKGDLVARIIDPLGAEIEVKAETDGILFARHDQLYAWPGKVIGKIAGAEKLPGREGHLLTD